MRVVDVLHRLNTEHEIRFLLTAYIETLQFYDATKWLPLGVTALPLMDVEDIEARFTELLGAELSGLERAHCFTQGAIAREATEVFGAAFTRLQVLRQSAAVSVPRDRPALVFAALAIPPAMLPAILPAIAQPAVA